MHALASTKNLVKHSRASCLCNSVAIGSVLATHNEDLAREITGLEFLDSVTTPPNTKYFYINE